MVYSTQLALVNTSTGSAYVTVYTVPTGIRTIIKELRVYSGGATARDFWWSILSGASARDFQKVAITGANFDRRDETWTVLNEGQSLRIFQSAAGALNILVSGYELDAA